MKGNEINAEKQDLDWVMNTMASNQGDMKTNGMEFKKDIGNMVDEIQGVIELKGSVPVPLDHVSLRYGSTSSCIIVLTILAR